MSEEICNTVNVQVRPVEKNGRRGGRPSLEQTAALDRDVRRAALQLFLENGYDSTSMESIAKAAGTTKASLYSRFPDKESLFLSVLKWAIHRKDWPFPEPAISDPSDLASALTTIAETSVRRAIHPDMVKLSRIAVAQAARFPEIAQQAHGANQWRRQEIVVELLKRHAATGSIVADNPEILAELFLGMASGIPARLASFGIVRDPSHIALQTQTAVDLFLRGLRPAGESPG